MMAVALAVVATEVVMGVAGSEAGWVVMVPVVGSVVADAAAGLAATGAAVMVAVSGAVGCS